MYQYDEVDRRILGIDVNEKALDTYSEERL